VTFIRLDGYRKYGIREPLCDYYKCKSILIWWMNGILVWFNKWNRIGQLTRGDYLRHSTRTDNFTMGDIPISDHSPLNIILILSTLVTFIITAIFNALAGSGAALGSIFLSSVGNISDVYQMDITPAGFTFSIWSVIYLWIAFSLLFFIITIFIKTDFGRLELYC